MIEVKCNILNPKSSEDKKYYPMANTSGETSYQIAVRNGYTGTEADWKKETSGTVEYVDTAGIANRSIGFKKTSIGSETHPIYINANGEPTAIGFPLGSSCELDATDDIEFEGRAIATTVALQDAIVVLFSKAVVPTVNGTLVYDGTVQSPDLLNYDERLVSAKGTLRATNAGMYTAIFTPLAPYMWTNGKNNEVSVRWQITKAECPVYVSATEVALNDENPSVEVEISRVGDGGILITNTNPEIASATLENNMLTITGTGDSGVTTIGITVREGTNYKESNTVNISVVASYETV
jgi:hypothetical protein